MAKRQSTTTNVVRLDGEGKTHAEGKRLTPLCNLKGNENHTWVSTPDAVDCARCVKLSEKQSDARERLEYAAGVRDTQDDVYSQGALRDLDIMAKGEPPVLPAVEPVKDAQGENITVPVDYDDASKGRRELDASKGERVLGETTFVPRKKVDPLAEMEALIARVRARVTEKMSDDQVEEIVRQERTRTFAPVFFEPTNPECPGNVIPALPAGVHPHTWEMAHDGNTEASRRYYTRQAEREMQEYAELQEAMEESRKAVEHNEENGYDVLELEKPPF